MSLIGVTQLIAGFALLFSVVAFAWRLRVFNNLARPKDRAVPKGSTQGGVIYALTLGMAPWSKESTRLHGISYMRGVAFHLGIFLCLGLLVLSLAVPGFSGALRSLLALVVGLAAIFGLMGFILRFTDRNLRALSTLDDYFAVLMVSLFLATAALGLGVPAYMPVFFLVSAVMLIYAPFSKIRHCIYFAYSRLFFGKYVGSHAVLPHSQQGVSHG